MIARYRSGETVAMGWALIGVALIILLAVFQRGFSADALLVAILVAIFGWLIAIRPAIVVYEHALIIQNVFRKHEIPWAAITQISATLLLTVRTVDGRKISAWAISSSGRARLRGQASKAEEIALELERFRVTYGS